MTRLKILMLAPSCYPPCNPEAFVNANLVSAMLEEGWQVDVVSCPQGEYQWYPRSSSMWKKVGDHSHSVKEHERTLLNRGFDALETVLLSGQLVGGGRWAVPAARQALKLASKNKYDIIMSRSLPVTAHLAGQIIAGKTGIPWVANWNDPSPDSKWPEPYRRSNGAGHRLGYWETRFYRTLAAQAAWHTFPCERLRNYICGYLPGNIRERSSVIPHVSPVIQGRIRRRHRGFTLLHAGSLRHPRDPRVFLYGVKLFYERLKPREPFSVRFIVDRPDEVANAAGEYGIESLVQIEPCRSYEEMPLTLAEAAVLVIIEAKMNEGIFLPSKFVDYVQTGRPILAVAPKIGTLADILSTHGGGLVADCTLPESVAMGIATLYESWRTGTLDESFASDGLIRMFDKDAVLRGYREIFGRLGIRGS